MSTQHTQAKTPNYPRRMLVLIAYLARLIAIRRLCREIGMPMAPDSTNDRRIIRSKMNELRTFMPPNSHKKLRLYLVKISRTKGII